MKKILVLATFFLLFTVCVVNAQDMQKVRQTIKELCAKEMFGRGYLFEGDKKAAEYIANEFENIGVEKFQNSYFQPFEINVNTFPSILSLQIGKNKLVLGHDFIPKAGAKGGVIKAKLFFFDSTISKKNPQEIQAQFVKKKLSKKVLVFQNSKTFSEYKNKLAEEYLTNIRAVLVLQDKLTFSVATYQYDFPVFDVLRTKISKKAKKVQFQLVNKYIQSYQSQNVIAFVKGKKTPEKHIVFSAHYDHLGGLGKEVYFAGANDNAASVAMLFELAKYYKQNPPDYTLVFMAFAAEEAGLLGSKFYVENPLFPLKDIHFLLNLDLIGTGSEGMTVVNGSIFEEQFQLVRELNKEKKYTPNILKRGAAANSDHYFFYKKDVPSFFIYLRGGIQAYHDIFDKEETLPLTGFQNLYLLLLDFVSEQ
jgi:hypothetical protein